MAREEEFVEFSASGLADVVFVDRVAFTISDGDAKEKGFEILL